MFSCARIIRGGSFRRTRRVIYGKEHKARRARSRGNNKLCNARGRAALVSAKAGRGRNTRRRGMVYGERRMKLSSVPRLVYFQRVFTGVFLRSNERASESRMRIHYSSAIARARTSGRVGVDESSMRFQQFVARTCTSVVLSVRDATRRATTRTIAREADRQCRLRQKRDRATIRVRAKSRKRRKRTPNDVCCAEGRVDGNYTPRTPEISVADAR